MNWAGGAERRKFVRANFPCKITIFTPTKHTLSTHTENIGAGGVRIIIEEKIDISSMVNLSIYLDKEPIRCKGRIVWVVEKKTPFSGNAFFYDTGIEFYEINDDDRRLVKTFVDALVTDEQ